MANYLIGDIHGCYREFKLLLEELAFNPSQDTLYLAGDLGCRGHQAVKCMDLAMQLDARMVLGNNDLRMICLVHEGLALTVQDNLEDLLSLPKRKQYYYTDWLIEQPLFLEQKHFALVHASLDPLWSFEQAQAYAKQASTYLRSLSYAQRGYYLGQRYFSQIITDLEHKHEQGTYLVGSQAQDQELRMFAELMHVFTVSRYRQLVLPEQASNIFPYTSANLRKRPAAYQCTTTLLQDPSKPYVDFEYQSRDSGNIFWERLAFPWFSYQEFLTQLTEQESTWVAKNPNLTLQSFTKPLYFGHWRIGTTQELPPGIIGTDSGCVEGDSLTAYALPTSHDLNSTQLLDLATPIARVAKLLD